MSKAVDISADLGPVRDQGRRGTCLAFAAGAAHETSRLRRRGVRPDLGEELLYWRCKQIDSDGEEGTQLSSVAQALDDPGQSAAFLWPYDADRNASASSYQPPPAALEAHAMRRASLSETEATLPNISVHLEGGKAVVLGIDLWPQFFQSHAGELVAPATSDLLGAPHAVTVVGFDSPNERLLIRNSWGQDWGREGHAQLPARALEVACLGAWIVADDIDD